MAKLIGTAGHVDHGKTTLIQALTGIDADRLPEEKRRGMTIDIGFAYVDIPGHGRVSIVDVPGHEKFVTNMLVGALGIDVALLCVAANEGVMPQTREHFEIVQLLPVDRMVVALTKCDAVDAETKSIALAEVDELLAGTRFEGSPVVEVSAKDALGLDELKSELAKALGGGEAEPAGPWYLPIDRAFSVKGHGVVVTGTLAQGEVRTGEKAILQPGNVEVRVRSLHTHGEEVETSERGRRTAINLGGIKLEDVHRGQAVGAVGALFETWTFDAKMSWVGERKHGMRVRVSIGAEEVIGKLFLNDADPSFAQLRLEKPTACALGQPLIVRRYSPPNLIGGGVVAVPVAKARRKSEAVQAALGQDHHEKIIAAVGTSPEGIASEELARQLGSPLSSLAPTLDKLSKEGAIRSFSGLWISQTGYEQGAAQVVKALEAMHEHAPTQASHARERVLQRAGLKWGGKALDRIISTMVAEGKVSAAGTNLRLKGFRPRLSDRQQELLERAAKVFIESGINAPSAAQVAEAIRVPPQAVEEILKLGLESGRVVRVADGLYYAAETLEDLKAQIAAKFRKRPFSASEIRDALGTSRKYVIPLLEHFDAVRFTLRVGDNRVVRTSE